MQSELKALNLIGSSVLASAVLAFSQDNVIPFCLFSALAFGAFSFFIAVFFLDRVKKMKSYWLTTAFFCLCNIVFGLTAGNTVRFFIGLL